MSVYREDLDKTGCSMPFCEHDHSVLFLAQHCHPDARIIVKYVKAKGAIEVLCGECNRQVVEIQVAHKRPTNGRVV